MKAHPALFEERGRRGSQENEALLFQSTVDIHFQNAHKTRKIAKGGTLCAYLEIQFTKLNINIQIEGKLGNIFTYKNSEPPTNVGLVLRTDLVRLN